MISQEDYPTQYISLEEIVRLAKAKGAIGVAYTYTEPLIWFEYVMDTSRLVREAGLKNVLVTNGTINAGPLEEILPLIDAMNVDIKSMDPAFYKKVCRGKLEPVLETVRRSYGRSHVEVTNLVIPGFNDSDEMFEKLTDFLAGLSPLIPLHFSRYHPAYKMTAPMTPFETLKRAARIASEKLKYVYIGNVPSESHNQTFCPECGEIIIERLGYTVVKVAIHGGRCDHCGADTAIVTE